MTMMMADADAGSGSGLNQVVWEIERKLCASCPWAQDILTMVTATAQGVDTSSAGGNSSTARLQVRKLECAIVRTIQWNHGRWREREREREGGIIYNLFQHESVVTYVCPYLNPHQTAVWSFWMHPPLTSTQNIRQWWWGCTEGASAKKQSQHSGFKIQRGCQGPTCI